MLNSTQMLNSIYLNQSVQTQVRDAFYNATPFPSITLYETLTLTAITTLCESMLALPFKHTKNPLLHSFATAPLPKNIQKELSASLLPFVSYITKKKRTKLSLTAYKLSWKDYQILHDSLQQQKSTQIIIDLTPVWNPEAGGTITYVDGTGEYLSVPIKNNTLTIIEKNKEVNYFIQYINNKAKNQSRYFLMGTVE